MASVLAVVKCFFGLQLPTVRTLRDLEMGFPEEFFSEVVYTETRRALDAVDDDNKVIAWVSTGVSAASLPLGVAVEIEGIFEIRT